MSDDVREQVRRTVADAFDVSLEDVTEEPLPESIDNWDSITHLNLILALEQQFGVAFAVDELAELTSVGALVEAVTR